MEKHGLALGILLNWKRKALQPQHLEECSSAHLQNKDTPWSVQSGQCNARWGPEPLVKCSTLGIYNNSKQASYSFSYISGKSLSGVLNSGKKMSWKRQTRLRSSNRVSHSSTLICYRELTSSLSGKIPWDKLQVHSDQRAYVETSESGKSEMETCLFGCKNM